MIAKNKQEAADAILAILKRPKLRNALIVEGRKVISNLSWEHSLDKFLKCITMVAAK